MIPIDSCTSNSPKIDPVLLTIRLFSEKSSLSTKELITDPGSELAAVEAGQVVIHASI